MNISEFFEKSKKKLLNGFEDLYVYLARKKVIASHQDHTKFIILSRSRTGSNMLCSYLGTHPHMYVRKEILAKRNGKPVDFFLNRFFDLQPKKIKAAGFKIFYYHPLDDKSDEVWEALERIRDLRIIHLKRRNLFEMHVSLKKARLTDAWVARNNTADPGQIMIDPEDCEKAFQKTVRWQKKASERFSGHDMLEIIYEELVEDPSKQLEDIQQFLNVPVYTLYSSTKKQRKRPIQQVVSNYDELKKHFKNTQWESFFE